jgi:nucleoside-diphosphate-sugar epimerase
MRVLVTGAASMMMAGLVRALTGRGDSVVCLQRRDVAVPDGVEVIRGDIRDAAVVARAVRGCEGIVHGAARVGITGSWNDFASVNIDGTRSLLEAARTAQVSRFVHVSTPSVAHIGHSLMGDVARAAHTGRRGRAHYSESKARAENLALASADADLGVVAIRPHLVWGPGDTQLVGRIHTTAQRGRLPLIGGGRALVDTTYVDNAVDALIAALDAVHPNSAVSSHAYLVANGEPRPIRDLLVAICAAAGLAPREVDIPTGTARLVGSMIERIWPHLRKDEAPLTRFVAEQLSTAHWFDLRATWRDLQWRPRVTLDQGLKHLASSIQ